VEANMDKEKALKILIANAICGNHLFEGCEECPFHIEGNEFNECNEYNNATVMEAVKTFQGSNHGEKIS